MAGIWDHRNNHPVCFTRFQQAPAREVLYGWYKLPLRWRSTNMFDIANGGRDAALLRSLALTRQFCPVYCSKQTPPIHCENIFHIGPISSHLIDPASEFARSYVEGSWLSHRLLAMHVNNAIRNTSSVFLRPFYRVFKSCLVRTV